VDKIATDVKEQRMKHRKIELLGFLMLVIQSFLLVECSRPEGGSTDECSDRTSTWQFIVDNTADETLRHDIESGNISIDACPNVSELETVTADADEILPGVTSHWTGIAEGPTFHAVEDECCYVVDWYAL